MRSHFLYLANAASSALPTTRGFRLRRALFTAGGVSLHRGARLLGRTRIDYPNVVIGESWIGAGTHVIATVTAPVVIGHRCDVGPGVLFVVGSHEIGTSYRRAGTGRSASISIGDGTWIGARVTVLGGTEIGKGSVIAAGAVVKGTFPPNVLIAGVPARIVRDLE